RVYHRSGAPSPCCAGNRYPTDAEYRRRWVRPPPARASSSRVRRPRRVFPGSVRCADGAPRLDVCPFGLEALGDQESQLECMAGIEARIAMRVVAIGQADIADRLGAAGAFGDVLARHLEMHAAGMRAFGTMRREEGAHLAKHAVERPRLVAGRRLDRVA